MAELFDRNQSVISRHINNSFIEEVNKESNMHFLHIANSDKPVAFYSLMFLAWKKRPVKLRASLRQFIKAYLEGMFIRRWRKKLQIFCIS